MKEKVKYLANLAANNFIFETDSHELRCKLGDNIIKRLKDLNLQELDVDVYKSKSNISTVVVNFREKYARKCQSVKIKIPGILDEANPTVKQRS